MRWGCATLRRLLLNLPSKTYFYAGKQATIITFEHNFIRASSGCQNQSRLPRRTRRRRRGRRRRCLVLTGWWRWDCRLSICTRLSGIGIGNVFATASGTGTGAGRPSFLPLPPSCHWHRRVYCIVLCSFESYSVVVYGPRQIERSPGVAAVSVSASHCRKMTSLPLPCLLSPYLLASPYWQLLLMASQYLARALF